MDASGTSPCVSHEIKEIGSSARGVSVAAVLVKGGTLIGGFNVVVNNNLTLCPKVHINFLSVRSRRSIDSMGRSHSTQRRQSTEDWHPVYRKYGRWANASSLYEHGTSPADAEILRLNFYLIRCRLDSVWNVNTLS